VARARGLARGPGRAPPTPLGGPVETRQDFILNLLHANRMLTPQLQAFIYQDVAGIAKELGGVWTRIFLAFPGTRHPPGGRKSRAMDSAETPGEAPPTPPATQKDVPTTEQPAANAAEQPPANSAEKQAKGKRRKKTSAQPPATAAAQPPATAAEQPPANEEELARIDREPTDLPLPVTPTHIYDIQYAKLPEKLRVEGRAWTATTKVLPDLARATSEDGALEFASVQLHGDVYYIYCVLKRELRKKHAISRFEAMKRTGLTPGQCRLRFTQLLTEEQVRLFNGHQAITATQLAELGRSDLPAISAQVV